MHVRKVLGTGAATALLVLSSVSTADAHGNGDGDGGGHGHRSKIKVILEGLSSPKGLAVNGEGDAVVGQGAFGAPGPVLRVDVHGRHKGTTTPVTDPTNVVDVAANVRDGSGWAIGTDLHLYHRLADGTIVDVLDIPGYQATDPDPVDNDMPPNPIESNPYGLTLLRNGDALVADAAGNDIIRVTPDGVATTVARFDLETVSTGHLPPDFPMPDGGPLPPTWDAESVPTTVTIGPDGAIYVGELKGVPFRPGSSNIWRIEKNATDAWCSVDEPDPTGKCTLYSTGYTAIQDIAFDRHSGKLYVYELAADGVFAFEAGFDPAGPGFPPAVLLEVKRHRKHEKRTELATGELSQPGGVVVANGHLYVTDGIFSNGRLIEVKRGH
jgi:hypothetical protein